jgi:lincosamide nucleotidyltransferase B/F
VRQPTRKELLNRLEEIGRSVAATGNALAVIGLGSVGVELERLDDYSDLDFFVIVQPGQKERFLADLHWLSDISPVAYRFRNTADGYKLLYEDGIFCEFGVFEEAELGSIPFAEGRIVWKAEGVADTIRLPRPQAQQKAPATVDWLLGEALTCLYVGLCRFQRGEKLSAQRFIQHFAVDRVLELLEIDWDSGGASRDPFALERRFEQRFPAAAAGLPFFVQGYERSPQSAQALLHFLGRRFPVNPTLKNRIEALIALSQPRRDNLQAGNLQPSSQGEPLNKVSLAQKFKLFSEHWSPKVVAELNGQQVKVVKLQGPFVWHHHEQEDELFLVVKGRLRLEFRDRHVWLEEGELLVVPRGVEHRPVADEEVHVVLFEPASTLNTGNVRSELTVDRPQELS